MKIHSLNKNEKGTEPRRDHIQSHSESHTLRINTTIFNTLRSPRFNVNSNVGGLFEANLKNFLRVKQKIDEKEKRSTKRLNNKW